MHFLLYLLIECLMVFRPFVDTTAAANAQSPKTTQINSSQAGVQEVTLCSRIPHKEDGYGRSAFSFKHGLRSDSEDWLRITHNYQDLVYGSIGINNDTDWFSVSMGEDESNWIKDIGELTWSQLREVPILPATPHSSPGFRLPRAGESFEESSEGRVTRAALGHIYVIHSKSIRSDHYALFRVDALQPGESCTLSWKVIPSPEKSE